MKVTIPWDKPSGIRFMPSGFMPVVIDLLPSMKVTIPRDKPSGIRFMPSGFMPVVFDLQPSMKVTIPWDKPSGIRFMPSAGLPSHEKERSSCYWNKTVITFPKAILCIRRCQNPLPRWLWLSLLCATRLGIGRAQPDCRSRPPLFEASTQSIPRRSSSRSRT